MSDIDTDDRGPNPKRPFDTPAAPSGTLGRTSSMIRAQGLAKKPEKIEDRPTVSEVRPEDYPAKERKDGDVTR